MAVVVLTKGNLSESLLQSWRYFLNQNVSINLIPTDLRKENIWKSRYIQMIERLNKFDKL